MYNYPYVKPSLFSRIFGATRNFSFSNFLDGTQKTLGIINQAIPIVYQIKPMFQNAKTMFRIADEIRKPVDTSTANVSEVIQEKNKPVFYI